MWKIEPIHSKHQAYDWASWLQQPTKWRLTACWRKNKMPITCSQQPDKISYQQEHTAHWAADYTSHTVHRQCKQHTFYHASLCAHSLKLISNKNNHIIPPSRNIRCYYNQYNILYYGTEGVIFRPTVTIGKERCGCSMNIIVHHYSS
jgi:hypothetical protein